MTDNLEMWKGEFGNDYHQRNIIVKPDIEARYKMWDKILHCMAFDAGTQILEIGAGQGINLLAINKYFSEADQLKLFAVEPNDAARESLKYLQLPLADAFNGTITDLPYSDNVMDIVFTSGVLIHIPREDLATAFDEMYRVSKDYILMIEYFSPTPKHIPYHGKNDALWADDYGSLFWSWHAGKVELIDYGFEWKRVTGLDNLTWWIFKKVGQ